MRRTILTLLCMAFTGVALYILLIAIAAARSGLGLAGYGPLLVLDGALWCAAVFLGKKAVRPAEIE